MARLFFSYRRDDAPGEASHLAADLRRRFGDDHVFLDVAAIEPGADFRLAIERALQDAAALLVVIGPQWLSAADADGRRRLDDAGDFVRLEVAAALQRALPVLPVLVRGAAMPTAKDLPADIQELAWRQAAELSHKRWDYDVGELIVALEKIIQPSGTGSALDAARRPKLDVKKLAGALGAIALVAAVVYAIASNRGLGGSPRPERSATETAAVSSTPSPIAVTFDVWRDLGRAPADRNVVKLSNEFLAVVIHGSRDIDVHQIDVASVRVSDGTGSGVGPALYFVSNGFDEDKDGVDDAKFDIKLDDLRTSANLARSSNVLQVWGRFKDRRPFRGEQRVRFVP